MAKSGVTQLQLNLDTDKAQEEIDRMNAELDRIEQRIKQVKEGK